MDPWLTCQGDVTIPDTQTTKFEDNFNPEIVRIFEKLPDSEEYIAILERKLTKIKNNPDVLAQLIAKREACMRQLLCEEAHVEEKTDDFGAPIYNSQVLRTVAPHRQALNQGEVIELIKYDQLQSHDLGEEATEKVSANNK